MEQYEAIIVGAGIAGLTCASYLAKGRIRTLLVEKEKKTEQIFLKQRQVQAEYHPVSHLPSASVPVLL